MADFIPYARHDVREADVAAVTAALMEAQRGGALTQGPLVEQFEAALCEAVGAKHAVAVSSGTAALFCALTAHLGRGYFPRHVVTSPVTYLAIAQTARLVPGLSLSFDEEDQKHRHGADWIEMDYAGDPSRRGRGVLIDAAHSLGATLPGGRKVGSEPGALVCFSFHPSKVITTGEGGAVCTDDPAAATLLRAIRDCGRDAVGTGLTAGLNLRMPELAAALGLSQLRRLDEYVARRRAIAHRYYDAFGGLSKAARYSQSPGSAYHLFVLLLADPSTRDAVRAALKERGVGTQVHYRPVYAHPTFVALRPSGGLPRDEDFAARCLSIPLFPALTDAQVDHVIRSVREVLA